MIEELTDLVNTITMLKMNNKELRKYTQHKPDCQILHMWIPKDFEKKVCSCGLDNLLKETL